MDFMNISGVEPSDGSLGALQGLTRTCTRFKGSGKSRRCAKYVRRPGIAKGAKGVRIGTKSIKLASGKTVTAKVRASGRSLYVARKGRCFRLVSAKGGGLKLKGSKAAHCKTGAAAKAVRGGRKASAGLRRDSRGRFLKRGSTARKATARKASAGARKPFVREVRGRVYGWTKKGCYSYKKGAAKTGAQRESFKACKGLARRKAGRALAGAGIAGFEPMDMAMFGMPVGFGAVGEAPTGRVAVIDDGDLGRLQAPGRKVRRDAGQSRRCVQVRRSRTGSCVCAKWAHGKARPGEKLTDMCAASGLRLGIAPHLGRGRAFAGSAPLSGMSAADMEFLADASPKAGRVPRTCLRFETVRDGGLGRDVHVCTEFGDSAQDGGALAGTGLAVGPRVGDGALAGPLAKHYGFGAVGGGVGPMVAALAGGLTASVLAKHVVTRIPFAAKIPMAGAVFPALIAGGLAWTERFRTIGIGALSGIGLLAAYELTQRWGVGGALAGLDAITSDEMAPHNFGAITPDEMAAYDDVDVLAAYDDVDVLAGHGADSDVNVLAAGAFGSLPFAGAI